MSGLLTIQSPMSTGSKGNDVFYAPDINDRQETSWTASGFAETWFSPFGYDPIQDGHTDPDQGLLFDNSTGTLKVATNGGEITGHNFTHFVDSYYDDVFRGSDANETFYIKRGGNDEISGGAGDDVFQFKKSSSIESGDGILITDYQNGEQINIMNVGFSEADWVSQVSVSYDADADQTNVSINTEAYSNQNLIGINGNFTDIQSINLVYDHWRLRTYAESQTD